MDFYVGKKIREVFGLILNLGGRCFLFKEVEKKKSLGNEERHTKHSKYSIQKVPIKKLLQKVIRNHRDNTPQRGKTKGSPLKRVFCLDPEIMKDT